MSFGHGEVQTLNHPRHLLELGASKIQKVNTGTTLAKPIIVSAIDWAQGLRYQHFEGSTMDLEPTKE
jgi:hypothetical protein